MNTTRPDYKATLTRQIQELQWRLDAHLRLSHRNRMFLSCLKCQAYRAEIQAKETVLAAYYNIP